MRRIDCLFALPFTVVLVACGPNVSGSDDDDDDDSTGNVDAPGGGNGDADVQPSDECRKMDLIFVVDDSGSMSEEQGNLATNFPMFADLLNSYTISSGETLDYRAAVTTTGVTASGVQSINLPPFPPMMIPWNQSGQDGRFRTVSGMPRPWLERTDPNMTATFGQLANVGTNGPGIEMQLRAMELAVQPATNPGFVREDALLGVIILTDEDDCSFRQSTGIEINALDGCTGAPSIPAAADFLQPLDNVKGDRGRWASAVIAAQTACSSSFGDAVEGVRLKQFQQAGGTNVVFGDICAGNLQGALTQALDSFQAACENFPPID
jgi:hypothetical protein